ncbi:MAG: hypothetical protein K9N35_05750 [Candidatus Marinimicrobia bacterium]|nr:hypothetical protein [Candidatus Neomarinimicrobiota bacterium]
MEDSRIDAGYALFAKFENQQDWRGEDETWTTEDKGEEIIEIEEFHIYHMTVEFRLYERASGTYVYGIKIIDEARASESRTKSAGFVQGLIEYMGHGLIGGRPPEVSQR